jgi:multidrug efflux pump subunit AcrA (membrane-fusion protein)
MRASRPKVLIAAVAVLFVGGLVTWGFIASRGEAAHEAEREQPIRAPQRVSTQNGEPVITLDTAAQRNSGITTGRLNNARHPQSLRAFGTVLDLHALTDLSNQSANARAQVETSRAKLAASQTAFERAQELYKDQQNMSAAQLQAAEATFRTDQAGLAAAQSQLRTLAVTAQLNWGPTLSHALLNATPLLTRLTTRRDILLQVTLRPGQAVTPPPADAWVELDDGSRRPLVLVSAATKTDPRIQGVSFFFSVPATSGLLPGMSVVAFVPTSRTVEGVVVPPSAIVWAQGGAWAYFRTGPNTFARRAVPTDLPAPAGGYVMPGQADNVEVVIQGAQMLFSEEFRAQAQVSD